MSNKTINLGSRMQGSKPFLEIQAVNQDNFTFDANSTLNLTDSLTVQNLTLNGNFINNGGGSIGAPSAEYSTSITTPKIIFTDNLAEGLIIESSDGADYIVCNSTNGSEQINLKKKIFTDGNQLVCGTNGSRGILQYANIKNSTIDNTNTLSANTTGTASAWSSLMTLNLANPYSGGLMNSCSFNGSSTTQLDANYISEGSSAVHTFYMKNINSSHTSEYLQQRISFINPYSGTTNDYDLDNEIISQRDNLTFRLYNSYQTDYSCDLNLSPSIQNDMPSFNNFLYFSSGVSAGTRYMNILNTNTTHDTTTSERQYKTGIKLGNSGFYGSTNGTGDTFAEIMGNWRDAGIGQLRLTAIQGVNSSAQECGLLITDNAGSNGIQQKQNANNMIISGQQIDGITNIKYINGCAIGNSSHLGQAFEYHDSGGSVISGDATGYDNTLELKLADDTLQTSGSGLSAKLNSTGGLENSTGLKIKLKTDGGLSTDADGLFVSSGASSDEITDADNDTYIKVENTTDSDTVDVFTAGTRAMTVRSNQKVIIGDSNTIDNAKFNIQRTRPAYNAFNDIRDYYMQLGGTEGGVNTRVAMGFGKIVSNTNYPPAHIMFEESNAAGDTQGRLLLGCRSSTTGTDIPKNTLSIYNDYVGVNVDSPSFKMDIRSDATDDLFRIIGDYDGGASSFEIQSGIDYASFHTGNGVRAMAIRHSNRRVGIGNAITNPGYTLQVGSGVNHTGGGTRYFGYGSTSLGFDSNTTDLTSIYAEHSILTGLYFLAASDSRIKCDIEDIDDSEALDLINKIEPKRYNYIDPNRTEQSKTLGFVAQQVESVIPNAVKTKTNFIPDIMQEIDNPVWEACDSGYKLIYDISFNENETGKVKFYVEENGNEEQKELEYNDGGFIFDKQYNRVFIYGHEVNDFKTVNKDKIYAINVSATQELSRKVSLLETQNNLLQTENNSLLEQTQVMEDRINSLETLLTSLTNRVRINETTLQGLIINN